MARLHLLLGPQQPQRVRVRAAPGDQPGRRGRPAYRLPGRLLLAHRDLRWDIDRDRFVDAAQRGRLAHGQGRTAEAVAALRRAAAVYGGPLFEGDPAVGWFAPERVALQEMFFQVLERLSGLYLDEGDLDGAQGALERLLREDSCRESAHRLLMGCFARRGQGDLVARQYQRCTASLAADLDITPSPATTDLYRTLTRASR